MSDNQPSMGVMERLASVDSKLEKLIGSQLVIKEGGLSEILNQPDAVSSKKILPDPSEDNMVQKPSRSSARSKNPLPFKVAISANEVDSIFQKMEQINRDVEVMERVEKLERQNRKIVVLGSMFMTLTVLMLGVFAFLLVQSNLFNKGVFLQAKEKVDASQPSFRENTAKVQKAQSPEPVAKVNDPKSAESVAKGGDPEAKSAAPAPDPKPAEVTAPVALVGSITSNKYHSTGCKWAAKIGPRNLLHFSTTEEARKQGYIPCPTCRPPSSEHEKFVP